MRSPFIIYYREIGPIVLALFLQAFQIYPNSPHR